ncbi:MAG TPA: glutamate formimidoyltransferase [Levilinea sp.]|nr:glutamate formimidoyltransferase [Levilinea sp.]
MPLVECIPNFSDARRPEVIAAIREVIAAVPGVHVLDQHSDLDHNRTVITFVGTPAGAEEAAFLAIKKAAEWIDLNKHTGEHPRIGATDVVPFVPISDISMTECIEIARRLAKRVADELSIPVYLYEEAATRPERQNLENIRRGQYEGLKVEIGSNPERQPDYGPAHLGSAGATVIGARQPLIAYNVYLTTDDVSIPQRIARTIRHSSGGLRYVKAMGLLVEGRAQVSMNLTNYHQTPVARVVEMIRSEAQRYGVAIHHSELVGLIPQEALIDAAVWHLQLDQFKPEQILEQRLYEVARQGTPSQAQAHSFLDQLASGQPTPGGGSAAAYAGAAAAALVAMVARTTIGKKKYAHVEMQMWELIERAEGLRADLTRAVDEDADAFNHWMVAMRMPKDTPQQQEKRKAALQVATLNAARVPLQTAKKVISVYSLAIEAAESGNLNAISDAASGASLARAALAGAGLNVRTNLAGIEDEELARLLLDELAGLESQFRQDEQRLRQVLQQRAGLTLL